MSRLKMDTEGQGPDVVLLHGWGMNAEVWRDVAHELAADFCVHRVDLPGHGESAPLTPWTLETVSEQLMRQFPLPVHLVGWSIGGAVATRWASRWPQLVRSLSLVASSPCFQRRDDWTHAMPAETLASFAQGLLEDVRKTQRLFIGLQVLGAPDARLQLKRLEADLQQRPIPDAGNLQDGLQVLREVDLREEAAALSMPVSLHYGERDRLTPPGAGEWLAQAVPHSRLLRYPRSGHAPFLSEASQFTEALRQFLRDAS